MINIDAASLDSLLMSLPPPPDPRTRRPTREMMNISKTHVRRIFAFVGPPHEDEKARWPLRDDGATAIRFKTMGLVGTSARNEGTLLKVNMSIRDVKLIQAPICLDGGRKKLPEKTDLACWWCRHKFETHPVGCPYRITKTKEIHTIGIFCSCECALAYANDSHSHRIKLFSGSMTLYMRKLILGKKYSEPLHPAPHWSSLKAYGGMLTIEQFRYHTEKVVAIPSFLPLYPSGYNLFVSKRIGNCRRAKGNVFQEKHRAESLKKRNSVRKHAELTQKQKNFKKYNSLKLKMVKVSKKRRRTKNLFKKPKKNVLVL